MKYSSFAPSLPPTAYGTGSRTHTAQVNEDGFTLKPAYGLLLEKSLFHVTLLLCQIGVRICILDKAQIPHLLTDYDQKNFGLFFYHYFRYYLRCPYSCHSVSPLPVQIAA